MQLIKKRYISLSGNQQGMQGTSRCLVAVVSHIYIWEMVLSVWNILE